MKNFKFILGAISLSIYPLASMTSQVKVQQKSTDLQSLTTLMNQIHLADSLDQPQEVINLTDSLITNAGLKQNDDFILKAAIYKYINQIRLSERSDTDILNEYLHSIKLIHDNPYKAIGYLFYLINENPIIRTETDSQILDSWNNALTQLDNQPIGSFSNILQVNNFTQTIAPTLKDYLKFLYISNFYRAYTSDSVKKELAGKYLSSLTTSKSAPTAMYAQFIQLQNNLFTESYREDILKLYESYKQIPESGFILSFYNSPDKQKKAILIEEYLKHFPQSMFTNSLSSELDFLNSPRISLFIPNQVYPKTNTPFNVNSYMADQFALKFERKKHKTVTESYEISDPLNYQDIKSKLQLPKLADGTWNIVQDQQGLTGNLITITSSKAIGYQLDNRIIAVDFKTGEPLKKGSIVLYSDKKEEEYPLNHGEYDLTDFNNSRNKNRFDANFYAIRRDGTTTLKTYLRDNINRVKNANENVSYILTDKPIYKPGDSVRYKIWSWEATQESVKALNKTDGLVYLLDTNQKAIDSTHIVTDEYGTAWGGFKLPQYGLNGNHRIVAIFDPNNKSKFSATSTFQVEEYKAPTFFIQLNKPDSTYSLSSPIHISGKAFSYSGLPLRNQSVSYKGVYSPLYRFMYGVQEYNVTGEIKTDNDGGFSFTINCPEQVKENKLIPIWDLNITAECTDLKGETQNKSISFVVSDKKFRLNVKAPRFMDLSKAQPDIIIESKNLTNQNLNLTGRWELINKQKKIVTQGTWNSEEPLKWRNFSKMYTGEYTFRASYANDTVRKQIVLYNSVKKELALDTTLMIIPSEDDKNLIYLVTSEPELHVLYSLNRSDKDPEFKWIKLHKGMRSIELPNLPAGTYAALQVVAVKNYKFHEQTYKYDYAIQLDTLDISLSTFRDKLIPGSKENWTLEIRKNGITNIDQSVLAYMYDKALDSYLSYKVPFNVSLLKPEPELNITPSRAFDSNYLGINKPIATRDNYERATIQFGFFSDKNRSKFMRPLAVRGIQTIEYMSNDKNDIVVGFGSPAAKQMEKALTDLRTNFADCAFFYPNIPTDKDGKVSFSFTLPDLITEWKFVAIANTKDMQLGRKEYNFTAQKSLMIQANEPRFLRQGDNSQITATLTYLDKPVNKATVTFEIIDLLTNKTISQSEKEITNPQQVNSLSFPVSIPDNAKQIIVRLKASSGNFSDGEQFSVPVMSADIKLTETFSLNTAPNSNQTFKYTLPGSGKVISQQSQFKLELVKNPAWFVIDALSAMLQPANKSADGWISAYYANTVGEAIAKANPEFEKAIKMQLLNNPLTGKTSNTPWVNNEEVINKQLQQMSLLYESGQMEYLRSNAFNQLLALQNEDGGFSWFPGMSSSLFQTLNVLRRMGELTQLGVFEYGEREKMLQINALKFVDQSFVKMSKESKTDRSAEPLNSLQIMMLYVRSLYNDIPLAGETLTVHKAWINQAKYSWVRTSLYSKTLLANILYNYGFSQEANQIVKSIINYGVNSKVNGFWFPSNKTDQIATQVAVMQLFYNTPAKDLKRFEEMKLWLIAQKETRFWKTNPETLDAVFALTMEGTSPLKDTGNVHVYLGNELLNTDSPNMISLVLNTDKVINSKGSIRIDNQSNVPVYGALYRVFETPIKEVSRQSLHSGLNIQKEIIQKNPENKVGNEITVRLTITSDQTLSFVEVSDQLAACFQPQGELSQYEAGQSIYYYKEVNESSINFFIDTLPRGVSVIEYKVWLNRSGEYQTGIATVKSIYSPQYAGYSSNSELTIQSR